MACVFRMQCLRALSLCMKAQCVCLCTRLNVNSQSTPVAKSRYLVCVVARARLCVCVSAYLCVFVCVSVFAYTTERERG
jgi:hypothetical protein